MTEIWTECGFRGVKELLADSGAAEIVGHYHCRRALPV